MVVVFLPFFILTDVDVFDDIHPAGIYSNIIIIIFYHHYYHDDYDSLFESSSFRIDFKNHHHYQSLNVFQTIL